jgi:hypothetical protein
MRVYSTNDFNTFIEVAPDCPVTRGERPPLKGDKRTVANMQFDLLRNNPYKFTSDDVLFQVFAEKNELVEAEHKDAREKFFSKGQACFRASPLTKKYGWGVHNDKEGKIAIYGCETEEYKMLSADKSLKLVKAMRSRRSRV